MKENGKGKKYLILIFGAFAIFFTGYPHIWSIYQPYAMEEAGWSQPQASMCFYIYFVTFVFGNIYGGRIQDRRSPKTSVIWGGGIFTAAILLSAAALRPSPMAMYLTYGVMQGFGQGMIYTTIISTAQKWFPDKPGFASGVIVAANGLFGFFLAPISRSLLERRGIGNTFLIIGAAIGISWILGSIFICNPPEPAGRQGRYEGRQYTSSQMIRTRKFYLMVLIMLFGLIPYMLVSPFSQTIQIDRAIAVSVAVGSVMGGSIANAAARLVLPSAADRVGRIVCLKGVVMAAAAAMLTLTAAPAAFTPAAVILVYACYGGVMGSFPSLCSEIFGLEHSGENYGFVMFGIVIATLSAPLVTNMVLGAGGAMEEVFLIGAACAGVSYMCLLLLERELTDAKAKGPKSGSVQST